MALKDITLGQYFPGNSILHRLDPRTKLLMTVGYIAALFLATSFVGYGILIVLLGAAIAVSHVGVKAIVRGMRPVVFIVVLTGVLNLFYTPGEGEPLARFWVLTIYPEGIQSAVFMVLRKIGRASCRERV